MCAMSGRDTRQAGWHRRSFVLLSLQEVVETGAFFIACKRDEDVKIVSCLKKIVRVKQA